MDRPATSSNAHRRRLQSADPKLRVRGASSRPLRPATALASSDLRGTFLPPPPEKLKTSALYTSLPDAALHGGDVKLATSMDYMPGDADRLPRRLVRERIKVRPKSAASSFPVCHTYAATSFALKQQREIERFQKDRDAKEKEVTDERERRWAQLKATLQAKEQIRTSESTQKRRMRLARQVAAQQLRDQHASERELLSYDERRTRGGLEANERRDRTQHAYGLWCGVRDITYDANVNRIVQLEMGQRSRVIEEYMNEMEVRGRAFIHRFYVSLKTNILTTEKSERIQKLKLLAAISQWKGAQDAQITSFLGSERRARQKILDEEANAFFVVDQLKKDLLQKRENELRKEQEQRLAEIRAFEARQQTDRRDLEKLETDVRSNSLKNDEGIAFGQLKTLAAQEKLAAVERTHKRKLQEEKEWEVECMRQLQPVIDEEAKKRMVLEEDETFAFRSIDAVCQQQLEDIQVPISFQTSPSASSSSSQAAPSPSEPPEMLYRLSGAPVPIFPQPILRRKPHSGYHNTQMDSLECTIRTLDGACLGDEVDLNATEVMSLKEKSKALSGLRILDGDVVEEDGTVLCSIRRGDSTSSGEFCIPSPEELTSLDGESSVKAAMKAMSYPNLTLSFSNIEASTGLQKVVERCLQALVFHTDSLSTNYSVRHLEISFTFTFPAAQQSFSKKKSGVKSPLTLSGTPSLATSDSSQRKLSSLKPKKPATFRLDRKFQIGVAAPLLSLFTGPYSKLNHHSIIFDVKKRSEGTKMFVPLFPASVLSSVDHTTDFSGGSVRFKWVEGHGNDDALQFASSDTLVLRRDELKFDHVPIGKSQGKILPNANLGSKEVAFNFFDNSTQQITMGIVERLLTRMSYTNLAASPGAQRRVLDVILTEPKRHGAASGTTSVIRIDVIVCGLPEQNLSVCSDDNNAIVLRDAVSSTPDHLRDKLEPINCRIARGVVLDSFNNLATRDAITSGYVRAAVIRGGRQWDTFTLITPPNASGNINFTSDSNNVHWAPNVAAGHSPPPEGTGTQIGKLRTFSTVEGKLRPSIEIQLCDGKLSSLQLLVRSIVFSSRATEDTMGCNKTIMIEIFIPEAQARKGKESVQTSLHPTRFLVNVTLQPSAVTTTHLNNVLKIPRTPLPVNLKDLRFDISDDTIFDGGCLKVSVVDGHSGMEEVLLDLVGDEDVAIHTDDNSEGSSDESESDVGGAHRRASANSLKGAAATTPTALSAFRLEPTKDGQLILMKQHVAFGTCLPMVDNRPLTLTFPGRRKVDQRLDMKTDMKAPTPIVRGSHVSQLLTSLCYLHHEHDPLILKTCLLTLEDTFGRLSQCVFQLDVVPIHLPSELDSPPEHVYYRQSLATSQTDGTLAIFSSTTITDEDTERCGDGVMAFEPFVGAVSGDFLTLLAPPRSSKLRFESISSPSVSGDKRTSIYFDEDEIGLCIDSIDPKHETNQLRFSIRSGTPLDACTAIMRQIAFGHKDKFPAHTTDRQYQFRFNAGDEDVPDTKQIVTIHVAQPLLYTLPLYETMTYKEGVDRFQLFPRLIIGMSGTEAKIGGDVLKFLAPNSLQEDMFFLDLQDDEDELSDLFIERGCLVATVSATRRATGEVLVPTAGYSGVKLGKFSEDKKTDAEAKTVFRIDFDEDSVFPSTVLLATVASKICYRNSSLGPSMMPRDCTLAWHRKATNEEAQLAIQLHIDATDDMTDVNFKKTILNCFEGEKCFLGLNATVSDTDTDTFAEGSSMVVEVAGGSATDSLFFNRTHDKIFIMGKRLLFAGEAVGVFDDVSTKKRMIIHFIDCPLSVVEVLVQQLVYQTDRLIGEKSKLIQLTIRGSAEVTPTLGSLQVNVHRRPLDMSAVLSSPTFTLSQGTPMFLFQEAKLPASEILSGAVMTLQLVNSTPTQIGRPITSMDRLTLTKAPEHLTMTKTSVVSKTGATLGLNLETIPGGIIINFPKVTKQAVMLLALDLLQLVAYEYGDSESSEPQEKSKRSVKRKESSAAQRDEMSVSQKKSNSSGLLESPSFILSSDKGGLVCCCLEMTVPLVDGGTMSSRDYITMSLQ